MRQNLLSLPQVFSATTGREETLETLKKSLPQASNTSSDRRTPATIEMEQVHGATIAILNTAASTTPATKLPGTDAVLSTLPDTLLVVRTADCLPILLYHPSGVVGAIHAGRKSTQAGILYQTLTALKQHWGVAGKLTLWLGPHICADCYEVNRTTKEHYDLLAENLAQLHQVFAPNQVVLYQDKRCTAHHNIELYSYRKNGSGVPMNYSGVLLARNDR